jgi:coenzyme F420-0:L-glutamate ligase / coenzyme F420-1:gamma-L-glutamate ligase
MSPMPEELRSRRSIRKYQQKPIPKQVIAEVLEAAIWAPSAHNAQPWRFIVLTKTLNKWKLSNTMAQAWAEDMIKDGQKIDDAIFSARVERFAQAPVLILACLTMDGMHKQPDKERQNIERDLALESFGAAIQNLLLMTNAKGLGACWFCAPAFCKETVRKNLKLPDDIDPSALVAIGYPDEKPPAPVRKPFDELCFKDKWGSKF